MTEPNDKELLFMDLLVYMVVQYAECGEDEALLFVNDVMDKLDKFGLKIK